MFSQTIKPPWDSVVSPLGSKDPSGHNNLLGNSSIAPQASLPVHFGPQQIKAQGLERLFPCVRICQRGPQAALPVHNTSRICI